MTVFFRRTRRASSHGRQGCVIQRWRYRRTLRRNPSRCRRHSNHSGRIKRLPPVTGQILRQICELLDYLLVTGRIRSL